MIPFLALPPYTPGHAFSGRARELQLLDDWAASRVDCILVLEAIGGMGKSMLCWQWATRQAAQARPSFAGVFWYSFYERGADMADFCAQALGFITGRPVEIFRERKTADLAAELIPLLGRQSWLLVLDGLERVLVAYNRYDAAQVRDDALDVSGESAKRKAEDCIRPADSNLLNALTGAMPSKILISSRLMPSALVRGGLAKRGVRHERLTGLAPEDAEAMLKGVGVCGDSLKIQNFLGGSFDCHPLMVGIVGGLVKNDPVTPGDFDCWIRSQTERGFAALEPSGVVERRNKLLAAAFDDLSAAAQMLLARVGLISEAVDEETMAELNPQRPDPPEEVYPPEEWQLDSPEYVEDYHREKADYSAYLVELDRWRSSPELAAAEPSLRQIIRDLSARGLLQCDPSTMKYDLHPVVRSYAVSLIAPDQRDRVGQRVVDHFSSRSDVNSEDVKTLDDLRNGLQVARTLLQLGRADQAASAVDSLESALFWSLEAWDVYLALAKPLFPDGWTQAAPDIDRWALGSLSNGVALALNALGKPREALSVGQVALDLAIEVDDPRNVLTRLRNLAMYSEASFQFNDALRLRDIETGATAILGDTEYLALAHLSRLDLYRTLSDLAGARHQWLEFDALPRPASRHLYRRGTGEFYLAVLTFHEGQLDELLLAKIDRIARDANSRWVVRELNWLRGEWKFSQGSWAEAAAAYEEHIRLTREANLDSWWSEARLALVQLKLGQSRPFVEVADRIAVVEDPPHAALAELYLALGEKEKARKSAVAGYREAWGQGAPYVDATTLDKCRKVFQSLGDSEPTLKPFDLASVEPFAFERRLAA